MTAVLTYSQFRELAASHPRTGLDESPYLGDADSPQWLGYVSVTWEDRIEFDPDEADDCKEVGPFNAPNGAAALKAVQAVYGPYCQIESLDDYA